MAVKRACASGSTLADRAPVPRANFQLFFPQLYRIYTINFRHGKLFITMRKLGSDGLKVHLLTITKFEHTQILTVVFGRHALYLINVSIVIASSTVPGVPHQVLI